jgi:hypothetical protein
VVERDWERELAEIVSRVDPEPDAQAAPPTRPVSGGATLDLRDHAVAAAPGSDELAEWVERLGASLLRLVDRRLVDLRDEVSSDLAALDTRIDVLIDVVEALSAQLAAVARALDAR